MVTVLRVYTLYLTTSLLNHHKEKNSLIKGVVLMIKQLVYLLVGRKRMNEEVDSVVCDDSNLCNRINLLL